MTEQNKILIATRKSPLALWQANTTLQLLAQLKKEAALFPVVTTGDKMQHAQLSNISIEDFQQPHHLTTGKGLFIKEVQEALLNSQAHVAVHSMKDLPVTQTPGLVIGALLPRASPSDVLVLSPQLLQELNLKENLSKMSFEDLKKRLLESKLFFKNSIGTTSARRQFLMKRLFSPKLNLQILRGNVDSRLKKVNNNEFSAILLAHAGLNRLNLFSPNSMFVLPSNLFVPATAQGVVAIECCATQGNLIEVLQKFNCENTCLTTAIERMALQFLEGDCNSAVGAFYCQTNKKLFIYYNKENLEKNFEIPVTEEDLNELKKIFKKANKIYSHYYTNALQSSLAKRLKAVLAL